MIYYAMQVRSGAEQKFIDEIHKKAGEPDTEFQLIFLRRKMQIRRQGVTKTELQPLFPGYLFLEVEQAVGAELCALMRQSNYFYHFLKSNQNITPLDGHDLKILKHFMDFGDNANMSQVYFDENERIVVVEGPLKGFEGNIVKVDRRKHRVKIQIDFENTQMTIDLSYEMISGKGSADKETQDEHSEA